MVLIEILAVDKLIWLIYSRPFIVLVKIMLTTPIPNEKCNTFYNKCAQILKMFNIKLYNKTTSL